MSIFTEALNTASTPPNFPEEKKELTIEERTETLLKKIWPLIFSLPVNFPILKPDSSTINQLPISICRITLLQKHRKKTLEIVTKTLKGLPSLHISLVRQQLEPFLTQWESKFLIHTEAVLENTISKQSEIEEIYRETQSFATLLKELCVHWKQINNRFTDHLLEDILNHTAEEKRAQRHKKNCPDIPKLFQLRLQFCINYLFKEIPLFPPNLLKNCLSNECKKILTNFIAPFLIMPPPPDKNQDIPSWDVAVEEYLAKVREEIQTITSFIKPITERYTQAETVLQAAFIHIKKSVLKANFPNDFFYHLGQCIDNSLQQCTKILCPTIFSMQAPISPTSSINEALKSFLCDFRQAYYFHMHAKIRFTLQSFHLENLFMHAHQIEINLTTKLSTMRTLSPKIFEKEPVLKMVKTIQHDSFKQLIAEYFLPIAYCLSQRFLSNKTDLTIPILLSFYSHLNKLLRQKHHQNLSSNILKETFAIIYKLSIEKTTSHLPLFFTRKQTFMEDARGNKISLKAYTLEESKKTLHKTIPLAKERYPSSFNPNTPPPTDLQLETGSISFFEKKIPYAAAWAQGKRLAMEDSHFATSILSCPVFSVMDGHGGDSAAIFLKAALPQHVKIWLGIALKEIESLNIQDRTQKKQIIANAMKLCCIHLNCIVKNALKSAANQCGSTMVMTVIYDGAFFFINTGDSRVLIVSEGQPVIQGSNDADPKKKLFQKKIKKFGGFVQVDELGTYRVNGKIATARAFGDFNINAVSAHPKVNCVDLKDLPKNRPSYVVLACDGVFDLLSSERVGQVVLKAGNPEVAAKALVCEANAREGHDNMTALVFQIPKS